MNPGRGPAVVGTRRVAFVWPFCGLPLKSPKGSRVAIPRFFCVVVFADETTALVVSYSTFAVGFCSIIDGRYFFYFPNRRCMVYCSSRVAC